MEEKALWLTRCVGQVRVALMCCPLELEGKVLGNNKGIRQGAAGEAEMEDARGKILYSSRHAPFDF